MGLRNPPYTVRLPGDLGNRFNRLRAEFQGLPPSTLLRMLLAQQLARPLKEQSEIIVSQIRGHPLLLPEQQHRRKIAAASTLKLLYDSRLGESAVRSTFLTSFFIFWRA